ncbi:hypothetical protein ABZ690_00875 [Streptomyces sp. NPDC006967]|uniref:hypothetical protein n=1 Tax=Streptomyces sp. NPDC006967 TaxID=3156906 RepID=UPI0033D611C2
MSKQPTPEDLEAAAAEDVRRADTTLATLEQRVLDDDQDVTPAEIETARSARHFADLRQQAAHKKAATLREQQLAAAREQAYAEARAILAGTTQAHVDDALKTAADAMATLRATVRRHNDVRDRAAQVLARCPAVQPTPLPSPGASRQYWTGPAIGYATLPGGPPALWVDHEPLPVLDENRLMDQARKAPADADHQAEQVTQAEAKARRIGEDADLYQQNRPAFEQLPAHRRKHALDRLGVDWAAYMRERESTHEHEPIRHIRQG